jgi:hypothetical protein
VHYLISLAVLSHGLLASSPFSTVVMPSPFDQGKPVEAAMHKRRMADVTSLLLRRCLLVEKTD